MVTARLKLPQTYEDYLALPEGTKAELIDGVIYMTPQPRGRHVRAASYLGARLLVSFGARAETSAEGPGGWWIFDEPECHLATDRRVVVPDIAGWRRERMPSPPDDSHKFLVVPDWVCEVLSPSTAGRDTIVKMPKYREAGVAWAWIVDPVERHIDVYKADGDEWREVARADGNATVRLPPFDDVELDLEPMWPEPKATSG